MEARRYFYRNWTFFSWRDSNESQQPTGSSSCIVQSVVGTRWSIRIFLTHFCYVALAIKNKKTRVYLDGHRQKSLRDNAIATVLFRWNISVIFAVTFWKRSLCHIFVIYVTQKRATPSKLWSYLGWICRNRAGLKVKGQGAGQFSL